MLYDFKCPHRHMFEYTCSMDDRNKPIPCQGEVNQVVSDELYEKHVNSDEPLPEDLFWVSIGGQQEPVDDGQIEEVLMRKVSCQLQAKIFVGTHNNPAGALDHGSAANRDAAREGRYDPLKPNTRFMAKGRGYRK
jgi:hypothetical protein